MDTKLSKLEARVHKLERTNRALIAGLLIAVGGAVGWSPGTTDTLRAERLEIVGLDGTVRIALDALEAGPEISVLDEAQVVRARLSHEEEGTTLFLSDAAGDTRVGVAQFAHGGGGFALHGPEGKGAAVLYLQGDGSLTFYGDEGQVLDRFPGG